MGRYVYGTKRAPRNNFQRAMLDFERAYWTEALKRNGGNRPKTAQAESVNRTWLTERLRKIGIPSARRKACARFSRAALLASWGRPSAPLPTNRTAA